MEHPPEPPPPSGLAHRLRRAKLAAYPRRGAGDWTKEGHARSRLVEQLWRTVEDSFVRVPGGQADISERLEATHEPVVFTGLTEGWEASHWSVEQWVQRFGEEGFKVGRDRTAPAGTERPVLVRMADYAEYARQQCGGSASCTADDSPLYVFDASFGERPGTRALASEYAPPACFGRDVLELLGDHPDPNPYPNPNPKPNPPPHPHAHPHAHPHPHPCPRPHPSPHPHPSPNPRPSQATTPSGRRTAGWCSGRHAPAP